MDMFCSVDIADSNMSHECLHFCQRDGKKSWSPHKANLDWRDFTAAKFSRSTKTALRSCTV